LNTEGKRTKKELDKQKKKTLLNWETVDGGQPVSVGTGYHWLSVPFEPITTARYRDRTE